MQFRALSLVIALVATSCASDATIAETAAPGTTVAPAAIEAAEVAESTTVPETTTTTSTTTTTEAPAVWNLVGGGQIEPGSIEGQDTVLWFWAPW